MKFVALILFLLSAVLASHSGNSKYSRRGGSSRFEIAAQSDSATYNVGGSGEGGLSGGLVGGTASNSGNHTDTQGAYGGGVGGSSGIAGGDYIGDVPRYVLRGGTTTVRTQTLSTTETVSVAHNASAANYTSVANNASTAKNASAAYNSPLIKGSNSASLISGFAGGTLSSSPSTTYGDGNFNSVDIAGNDKGAVQRNNLTSTARKQTLSQLGSTQTGSEAHIASSAHNTRAVHSASALIKDSSAAVGSLISGFAVGTPSSSPITTYGDGNFNSITGNYDGDVRKNEIHGISGNFKQNLKQGGTIQTENAIIKVSVGVGVGVYTNGRIRTT